MIDKREKMHYNKYFKHLMFKPGNCYHIDKQICHNTNECIKCGRQRIEEREFIIFRLFNGYIYKTVKKKKRDKFK